MAKAKLEPRPVTTSAPPVSASPEPGDGSRVLFVGYRVAAVRTGLKPSFTWPSNYKPETAAAKTAEALAAFEATGEPSAPYVGRVCELVLVDPAREDAVRFSDDTHPEGIPAAFAKYLRDHVPVDGRDVHILGFDPKVALKSMAAEAAVRDLSPKIPPAFWYAASCYRDIESVLVSSSSAVKFELGDVVSHVLAKSPPPGLSEWKGPGVDPLLDATIAVAVARQFGLH